MAAVFWPVYLGMKAWNHWRLPRYTETSYNTQTIVSPGKLPTSSNVSNRKQQCSGSFHRKQINTSSSSVPTFQRCMSELTHSIRLDVSLLRYLVHIKQRTLGCCCWPTSQSKPSYITRFWLYNQRVHCRNISFRAQMNTIAAWTHYKMFHACVYLL